MKVRKASRIVLRKASEWLRFSGAAPVKVRKVSIGKELTPAPSASVGPHP